MNEGSNATKESLEFAAWNPWGRDPSISYAKGISSPEAAGHPPVNYHAYAACMHGIWARDAKDLKESTTDVLVLLRPSILRKTIDAIRRLQKQGVRCWVTWKESGRHQIAAALSTPSRMAFFSEICKIAEGFVASTPEAVYTYRAFGLSHGAFIPTPYPLDFKEWDFSVPSTQRTGIFIGTREFNVPSRNHLMAILSACYVARQRKTPVTVVAMNRRDARYLSALKEPLLRIVEGPFNYIDYLRLLASHRVVFQLDSSCVPGQVAGDALLARIPCVGGNGAIDTLTRLPHADHRPPEEILAHVLDAPEQTDEAYRKVWESAFQRLSFEATRQAMTCLFAQTSEERTH